MTVLSVFLTRFQLMATQNTREWIDEKDVIIVDGESGLLKISFCSSLAIFFSNLSFSIEEGEKWARKTLDCIKSALPCVHCWQG